MAGHAGREHIAGRVIHYLVDSSALWHLLRDAEIREGWAAIISDHGIGSCHPQRAEFRRSARDAGEYEQMSNMFAELFPDVPLPKATWQWAESAQYRLARAGAHRAFSSGDLLICAVAALRGMVILHDDNDFVTAARHLTEVRERRVFALP